MVDKGENQGVGPRLDWSQVSVSPQRFPSEKIVYQEEDFEQHPLFTGQLFIVAALPVTLPLARYRMSERRTCRHQILFAIADAAVIFAPRHFARIG